MQKIRLSPPPHTHTPFSNPRSTPKCIDYVILDMLDVIALPRLHAAVTLTSTRFIPEFSRKSSITGGEGVTAPPNSHRDAYMIFPGGWGKTLPHGQQPPGIEGILIGWIWKKLHIKLVDYSRCSANRITSLIQTTFLILIRSRPK